MSSSAYDLARELKRYARTWALDEPSQEELITQFQDFERANPRGLYRDNLPGHLTASALIVTPDLSQVLLTHHAKLNLWLQLGGHADGEGCLTAVALKEGQEESGLTDLRFLSYEHLLDSPAESFPLILDLDRHWIPARKNESGHFHYDVRYVLATSHPDGIVTSPESHELRWFALEEAYGCTTEAGMHRLFDKLTFLRNRIN